MNLHYAVLKVWSQNFTQFAFMTLFGKNVLFFGLEVLIAHVLVGSYMHRLATYSRIIVCHVTLPLTVNYFDAMKENNWNNMLLLL